MNRIQLTWSEFILRPKLSHWLETTFRYEFPWIKKCFPRFYCGCVTRCDDTNAYKRRSEKFPQKGLQMQISWNICGNEASNLFYLPKRCEKLNRVRGSKRFVIAVEGTKTVGATNFILDSAFSQNFYISFRARMGQATHSIFFSFYPWNFNFECQMDRKIPNRSHPEQQNELQYYFAPEFFQVKKII